MSEFVMGIDMAATDGDSTAVAALCRRCGTLYCHVLEPGDEVVGVGHCDCCQVTYEHEMRLDQCTTVPVERRPFKQRPRPRTAIIADACKRKLIKDMQIG